MCLYLDGEEAEGLASQNPLLLLGRLGRSCPRTQPRPQSCLQGSSGPCVKQSQYSATDDLVADPDSSCPFAVSGTWLTSWHTVSTK